MTQYTIDWRLRILIIFYRNSLIFCYNAMETMNNDLLIISLLQDKRQKKCTIRRHNRLNFISIIYNPRPKSF